MIKPKCEIVGKNGNIFNLLFLANKALNAEGLYAQADEMVKRVTSSNSYDEALSIIIQYVDAG